MSLVGAAFTLAGESVRSSHGAEGDAWLPELLSVGRL